MINIPPSPAQQKIADLAKKEFGTQYKITVGDPFEQVFGESTEYGDRYGGSDPHRKYYGYWEGKSIKYIGGECYHNINVISTPKAMSDGWHDDMMHHFEGKEGDFKTEPFFFTEAFLEIHGAYLKFHGQIVNLAPL
jgi:hypothetical protein